MPTDPSDKPFRFIRELRHNAPFVRRNHRLGVTAGMFAGLARDFLHPDLILAGLIYALTRSWMLVALIPVINKLGGLGPQLITGMILEHRPTRRPFFIGLTFVRSAAYAALGGTILLLAGEVSTLHLVLFYGVYMVCSVTNGMGYVTFMDMVGRLIPTHRVGALFGMREFLGGVLSLVAGIAIIQPILSSQIHLPMAYALLVGIGTLLIAVDMGTWCFCRERPGPRAPRRSNFPEMVRQGFRWLRADHNYRCYFWSRVSFRMCHLGLVFFIPYGTEQLGYEKTTGGLALMGGLLVAVFKLSSVLGSFLWGRLADRHGSRLTMIWGGVFLTLAPLAALGCVRLPEAFSLPLPWVEARLTLPLAGYLVSLSCLAIGIRAIVLGGHRFLVTTAPPDRRAAYVGFLNTITSPLTLLPPVGAWVAVRFGMETLFWGIVVGGVLALGAAVAMRDDRHLTNGT
ncbi:MAG: MFS transporter [Planctomycetota bacterium]